MDHELFIRRCFDLARLGAGHVSPNPMVGAVLVHHGRVIGEGFHQRYGAPHAEVNALASVLPGDRHLIPHSTLYVSLEPCCIFGRTPPCTNLILENKIPRVVISAIDLTPEVKGQGVEILRQAGVEVTTGVLQKEGEELARIRNVFASQKRPFITLKFAQSKDGFMGRTGEQIWISNPISKRLSHRLRSERDAILVGTNTALTDDPALTNRLWFGLSPLRILLDRSLRVPTGSAIFSQKNKTLVVTEHAPPHAAEKNVEYFQTSFDDTLLPKLLSHLFALKISSLIVEGGAYTITQFLKKGLWDEALVFTGNKYLLSGIKAPDMAATPISTMRFSDDILAIFSKRD